MGWIPDLDYAGWVTAIIAGIVGWYTIRNVQIARRAYVDSTYDRKVSQARLVWAEIVGMDGFATDSDITTLAFPPEDAKMSVVGLKRRFYNLRTDRKAFAAEPLVVFHVKLTNNSNEPVGR